MRKHFFSFFLHELSSCIHIFLWMVLFIRKGNLLKIITTFHAKKRLTARKSRENWFFSSDVLLVFVTARSLSHWNWCNIYYDFYGDWRMFCSIMEKISMKRRKVHWIILLVALKFKFMDVFEVILMFVGSLRIFGGIVFFFLFGDSFI